MSTRRMKNIRDILRTAENKKKENFDMDKPATLEDSLKMVSAELEESQKNVERFQEMKEHLEKTISNLEEECDQVDYLQHMFELRESFMRLLAKKMPKSHPDHWPLDLSNKENQQFVRDVGTRGIEEIWEMLRELRNWKPHRQTTIDDFDRDKFLEEFVDGLNYLFSVMIFAGFTADDLFDAYCKKDEIIRERVKSGY